jgi:hypothetical protein
MGPIDGNSTHLRAVPCRFGEEDPAIKSRLVVLLLAPLWFWSALLSADEAQWESVSADEANLVLYAPGLDEPQVSFKRKTRGLQDIEWGHWRPAVGASPEAHIVLFRFTGAAPSGMTWVGEPPLEERVRNWFRSGSVEIGVSGKYENVLGKGEYLRFTREGAIECVFMRQYGDTFSDQRNYLPDGNAPLGNIMILGYYCVATFTELLQATLERFVAGIGLKSLAVPANPQSQTAEGSTESEEAIGAKAAAASGVSRKQMQMSKATGTHEQFSTADDPAVTETLAALKLLHEQGVLSEDEYIRKQQEVIKRRLEKANESDVSVVSVDMSSEKDTSASGPPVAVAIFPFAFKSGGATYSDADHLLPDFAHQYIADNPRLLLLTSYFQQEDQQIGGRSDYWSASNQPLVDEVYSAGARIGTDAILMFSYSSRYTAESWFQFTVFLFDVENQITYQSRGNQDNYKQVTEGLFQELVASWNAAAQKKRAAASTSP